MKILVVDDEQNIREVIKEYAEFDDHIVIEAEDGMEAIKIARTEKPEMIIMDVMMPKLDGFSACKEIRKFSNAPIIMLSARSEEYDKLFGFEIGADDYVTKPFSPKELLARVTAVANRTSKKNSGYAADAFSPPKAEILKIGALEINFTAREVYVNGKKVSMTPKEYELLFYLVRNRGAAMSRENISNDVWESDFYSDENESVRKDRTIDTHIKMLRGSLGECGNHIVTVRGMGYKFAEEPEA